MGPFEEGFFMWIELLKRLVSPSIGNLILELLGYATAVILTFFELFFYYIIIGMALETIYYASRSLINEIKKEGL